MSIRVGDKFLVQAPQLAHKFKGEMTVKVVAVSRNNTATVRAITGNFGRTLIYAELPVEELNKKD